MAIVRLTQTIDRPVEEVFKAVIDVDAYPTWNPTTRKARKVTAGETGNGTLFELQIRGFGVVPQELQEFDRNRCVRLVPHFRLLTGGHRFRFRAEGQRTRVDHELEMIPGGVFRLFSPLMGFIGRKNLRETAAALKTYLEKRAALPDFPRSGNVQGRPE